MAKTSKNALRRTGGPGNGKGDALIELFALVTALKATVDDLVTKYNAHVHTENTAAAYAQNASTAATAVGSRVAAITATVPTVE